MTDSRLVVNPHLLIQPRRLREFSARMAGRSSGLTLNAELFTILAAFTEPRALEEAHHLLSESLEFEGNQYQQVIDQFVRLGVLVAWSPKLSWPEERRNTRFQSFLRASFPLRQSIWNWAHDALQAARLYRRQGDEVEYVQEYLLQSWRVSTARSIIIRPTDGGLFANYLVVVDVLSRVRADASVLVDWTISGDEQHFRYAAPGVNVWNELFEPVSPSFESSTSPLIVDRRLSPLLYHSGRDLLHEAQGRLMRMRYGSLVNRHMRIANPFVRTTVDRVFRERMQGKRCLGVHKRLSGHNAAFQRDGRAPSSAEVLARAESALREMGADAVVYLASDDDEAVRLFSANLGDRLVCREDVQRLPPGHGEVHRQPWGKVGIKDACDALIDAALLARCEALVHIESNVTVAASIMNPELRMLHV